MLKTAREGVTTIFDEEGELIAMIYKDFKSRKNVFFSCSEMSMEEIETLVKSDIVKIKPVEATGPGGGGGDGHRIMPVQDGNKTIN